MTDEKIMQLLDSEPSEGIRLLINRYSSLVYTVAYSKLKSVFSADDIEDFVSYIFSKIYERRAEDISLRSPSECALTNTGSAAPELSLNP